MTRSLHVFTAARGRRSAPPFRAADAPPARSGANFITRRRYVKTTVVDTAELQLDLPLQPTATDDLDAQQSSRCRPATPYSRSAASMKLPAGSASPAGPRGAGRTRRNRRRGPTGRSGRRTRLARRYRLDLAALDRAAAAPAPRRSRGCAWTPRWSRRCTLRGDARVLCRARRQGAAGHAAATHRRSPVRWRATGGVAAVPPGARSGVLPGRARRRRRLLRASAGGVVVLRALAGALGASAEAWLAMTDVDDDGAARIRGAGGRRSYGRTDTGSGCGCHARRSRISRVAGAVPAARGARVRSGAPVLGRREEASPRTRPCLLGRRSPTHQGRAARAAPSCHRRLSTAGWRCHSRRAHARLGDGREFVVEHLFRRRPWRPSPPRDDARFLALAFDESASLCTYSSGPFPPCFRRHEGA